MALIYSLHSEILKLFYKRATHIVLFLILVFQTFLANIGASQIVSVGIHATPETNPELAEAIPPIEFLGFDVTLFGVFIMIILGSIYGAEEYKCSAIRTSLLSITNRGTFLVSKTLVWLVFSFFISFLSIFLTINMTHYVLGQDGLLLFLLNERVWFYIFLASIAWTLLGLLAYIMALTFKNSHCSSIIFASSSLQFRNILSKLYIGCKISSSCIGARIDCYISSNFRTE